MKGFSKEQRNRLVLVLAGAVVVLAAVWFGPINSLGKSLATLSGEIREQESQLSNAKRLVQQRAEIEQNLQTVRAQLQATEQTMASGDMYAWIILTVNKFRADRKVEIPQFSREITGEVGLIPNFPYKAATFTVRGTAYFHDLGKFIADFENTFPYVRLENLEIDRAASASAMTTNTHPELLAFKMDIVSLINPRPL